MQDLHLPASDYQRMPWKNGAGATDEVWLWPPDADRDNFQIRISRAPIKADGAFSGFAGADRIITLIEGRGLALDFDHGSHLLAPLQPYRFDSGLAPLGRPLGGPVRVFNVMATRRDWKLSASVLHQPATLEPGRAVILALQPQRIVTQGRQYDLATQDTLILGADADARTGGPALVVQLAPARD